MFEKIIPANNIPKNTNLRNENLFYLSNTCQVSRLNCAGPRQSWQSWPYSGRTDINLISSWLAQVFLGRIRAHAWILGGGVWPLSLFSLECNIVVKPQKYFVLMTLFLEDKNYFIFKYKINLYLDVKIYSFIIKYFLIL